MAANTTSPLAKYKLVGGVDRPGNLRTPLRASPWRQGRAASAGHQTHTKNVNPVPTTQPQVFLGDQSVGKTSIITRFMYDKFDNTYQVRRLAGLLLQGQRGELQTRAPESGPAPTDVGSIGLRRSHGPGAAGLAVVAFMDVMGARWVGEGGSRAPGSHIHMANRTTRPARDHGSCRERGCACDAAGAGAASPTHSRGAASGSSAATT